MVHIHLYVLSRCEVNYSQATIHRITESMYRDRDQRIQIKLVRKVKENKPLWIDGHTEKEGLSGGRRGEWIEGGNMGRAS